MKIFIFLRKYIDNITLIFYIVVVIRLNQEVTETMIMKYRPFDELAELSSGFRFVQDTLNRMLVDEPSGRPWVPAVDILESEGELTLKADLPGIDMREIDIRIENGTLTLKGQRKFEEVKEGKGYHRMERSYGTFVRAFTLPDSVDPEKVTADYSNGVLTVNLGKKEIAKPRTVKVSVHSN